LAEFGAGVDPAEETSLCSNPNCDSWDWENVGASGLRCAKCEASISRERLRAFDREGLL
jgi:hypothetical protein